MSLFIKILFSWIAQNRANVQMLFNFHVNHPDVACQRFVGNRKLFNSAFRGPKIAWLKNSPQTKKNRPCQAYIYTDFSLRNGNMKWFHSTQQDQVTRPWWPSTATVTCTSAGSASRSKVAAAAAAAALGGNPAAAAFFARSLGSTFGSEEILDHYKSYTWKVEVKVHFGGIPIVKPSFGVTSPEVAIICPVGNSGILVDGLGTNHPISWMRWKFLVKSCGIWFTQRWKIHLLKWPCKISIITILSGHFIDSPHFILLFTFLGGSNDSNVSSGSGPAVNRWTLCLTKLQPSLWFHALAGFFEATEVWDRRKKRPTDRIDKGLSSIWDISHGSSSNL